VRDPNRRYVCDATGPAAFPGVVRPPALSAYPPAARRIETLFIGWNPPRPFGGFWSVDGPDNLRKELHGILRALGCVRAPRPDEDFLGEFLDTGYYFVHAVKCWSAAKYPGFGRGAKRSARAEMGEPLLEACAKAHLQDELRTLDPTRVCALGELAYGALRALDEGLDPAARPSEGRTFIRGVRTVLYTCFPSGNLVRGRHAREYTRDHLAELFGAVARRKTEHKA